MYTVAVKRDFIARHFLIGGDWGPENEIHAHHYTLELQLQGSKLNRHGYLVDIVDIEKALDELVCRYRDSTLNDLREFTDLNPSIEHFSRILCLQLAERVKAGNVQNLVVRLWENDIAWAAYDMAVA